MGLLFKNNAETTLSSGINNSVTTVPVASAAVFPTPDANNVFFATIEEGNNIEVVKVTGISSNNLTVVRAQDNTSAAAFGSGSKIELRLTAKILEMGTASLTDLDGDTKIQVEESDDEDKIRFDTGGTERMVITDAGRVGINNASPSRPFHVEMSGDGALFDRTGSAGGVMLFANGGTVKGNVGVQSGGFGLGGGFRDPDLFITTGGVVGIGTTSPSEALTVNGNIANASGSMTIDVVDNLTIDVDGGNIALKDAGTQWGNFANNSGDFDIDAVVQDKDIKFNGYDGSSYITALRLDMSDAGHLICNNNVTAFGSTSDIKLKENIEVIPDALDKVKQLKGVTFNYKKDGKRSTGLIAQDLEKVLPEVVYESSDIDNDEEKHLAVRYGNTVGLLVEAIKEQQEQIETLTAKVKELEDK